MSDKVSIREFSDEAASPLDAIVRVGAQKMLQRALEAEVDEFLVRHQNVVDEQGRRQVVRNGRLPARNVQTGAGAVEVQQPRVRDRRGAKADESVTFRSSILPPFLRKSQVIEDLIPWLYLRGISAGDMQTALEALLGADAPGFSHNVVTRLASKWSKEMEEWNRRDLSAEKYVYIWADGVYFNIRLGDDDRQCILVIMGATADGRKELLGVLDGYRESEQSWRELLLDLKKRGLELAPKIAVGDGALGFWAALRKVFPTTREQRCWVHKTANVLNCFPRSVQPKAKGCSSRDLDGGDERRCRQGVRPLREEVRCQVPEGRRLPGQGSRRAPGFLRLPRRALGAPTHDQSDRVDVRDRPSQTPPN